MQIFSILTSLNISFYKGLNTRLLHIEQSHGEMTELSQFTCSSVFTFNSSLPRISNTSFLDMFKNSSVRTTSLKCFCKNLLAASTNDWHMYWSPKVLNPRQFCG